MIHLDTSFLIRSLLEGSAESRLLRSWLEVMEPLGISPVSWTEFLCGPLEQEQTELVGEIVGEPAAYTETEARLAARLFNETGRRRGSLMDCMIAASAISAGAALATSNRSDFARLVPLGLRLT